MSPSKFLPSIYTIRGLRAAQGLVFLDILSAKRWLYDAGLEVNDHIRVEPAEIIYYGGALGGRSTEDLMTGVGVG